MNQENQVQPAAVYPGTFDPITNGHVDIIRRAAAVFGRIVVAVAGSSHKNTLFNAAERKHLVESACKDIPGVEVVEFSGLLIDFIQKTGASVIVRGLRAVSDFEYEFAMALMNKHLAETVETVFLATSEGHSFVSSSMIKEVCKLGGNIRNKVPEEVLEALQKKFR